MMVETYGDCVEDSSEDVDEEGASICWLLDDSSEESINDSSEEGRTEENDCWEEEKEEYSEDWMEEASNDCVEGSIDA